MAALSGGVHNRSGATVTFFSFLTGNIRYNIYKAHQSAEVRPRKWLQNNFKQVFFNLYSLVSKSKEKFHLDFLPSFDRKALWVTQFWKTGEYDFKTKLSKRHMIHLQNTPQPPRRYHLIKYMTVPKQGN